MFRNFFIVAFRNFLRNKIFFLINVVGLALGISAALVIYLIVHFEFSFDKFEKDNDRIYRVVTDFRFSGTPMSSPAVPSPLAAAVSSEVSGVEEVVALQLPKKAPSVEVPRNASGERMKFKHQPDIVFSDEHYFNLLSSKWLAGSPQGALEEPFKVVLSLERALVYFPGKDLSEMLGKTIIYNDSIVTTVAGIVDDIKENTDFHFKEVISLATIPATGLKRQYSWANWHGFNVGSQFFIKTVPGKNTAAAIAQGLRSLLKKYNKQANKDGNNTMVFGLQPLRDLHFDTVYGNFGDHTAHKPTLYALLAIAFILLLLGCINFINLATAHSSKRAKEIGIRKTMGSSVLQVMLQFLSETAFVTLVSTGVSVLFTPLLLRIFSDYLPKGLHFNLLAQTDLVLFLAGLAVTVAFFAGFYPSLVLSRYNPVLVLKNQPSSRIFGAKGIMLRKSLTVVQFFIAQFLLIVTVVTVKQIHFMVNKDMGVKTDAIVLFSVPSSFSALNKPNEKRLTLLNELRTIPGIQLVSLGSQSPSSTDFPSIGISYKDGKKEIEADVLQLYGDTNYIRLYNIKLLAGRIPYESDTTREFLVNESYLHTLGFQRPEDILGKRILGLPVVGVMKDFHQESLHSSIKPMMFSVNTNSIYTFQVILKPAATKEINWAATIDEIEKAYKKMYPGDDFSYTFFDENIAKFYAVDERISRLLKWASGLAVFISCMGLLGLVIHTTQVQTKEIGVRKVLGASVTRIVLKLSADFASLVLFSFVVAAPLAFWAASDWLENFAFRTSVSWWIFLLSGFSMILIAMITLSVQVIGVARVNPVKSLRVE